MLCGLCVKFFMSFKLSKHNFLFLVAETACTMPSTRVNTGQTNDSHSSVSLKECTQIVFIVLLISKRSPVFL